MKCSIIDCENIMCDTYIDPVGYICDDCQNNFISWLKTQKENYEDSEKWLTLKLEEFSNLQITTNHLDTEKVKEFFYKGSLNK